jgi:hypothetical protein
LRQLSRSLLALRPASFGLNAVVPALPARRCAIYPAPVIFSGTNAELMQGQRLPRGWATTLVDRHGRVNARFDLQERFLGTTLSPDLLITHSVGVISPTEDLDGTLVLRVVTPTDVGWSVAATVQQGLVDAAARAAIRNAVIGGRRASVAGT